jgi:hypothetical protein
VERGLADAARFRKVAGDFGGEASKVMVSIRAATKARSSGSASILRG